MKDDIFRKVSLERLSSPEQLDQLITVTTPRAWLALVAIGCILLAVILWGVFGSIPTKVQGQGILIKSGGIYNIVHDESGKITDIRVAEGDTVHRGDVLARVDQPQLVDEINKLKVQLGQLQSLNDLQLNQDIKNMGSSLLDFYNLSNSINNARMDESDYKSAMLDNMRALQDEKIRLKQAKINEENQQQYVDKLKTLFQSSAVSENDLINETKDMHYLQLETQAAATAVKERQESLAASTESYKQAQYAVQLLEKQFESTRAIKIKETEEKIKKLQDNLNQSTEIVSENNGRVLAVNVNKGDIVSSGTKLFSLEREGSTTKLEVVMYIPAEEGKKVIPGMEAQVSPTIIKKEEYGFMQGRVIAVSEYPTTPRHMMLTLGNEELVNQLSGKGASLEVKIDMTVDSSTVSGYKWSSQQGPPLKINSGTICNGSVTIQEQRPIAMVIPMVKKALSI